MKNSLKKSYLIKFFNFDSRKKKFLTIDIYFNMYLLRYNLLYEILRHKHFKYIFEIVSYI